MDTHIDNISLPLYVSAEGKKLRHFYIQIGPDLSYLPIPITSLLLLSRVCHRSNRLNDLHALLGLSFILSQPFRVPLFLGAVVLFTINHRWIQLHNFHVA